MLKVKQNKLTKMYEVVDMLFGSVLANFYTRSEAIAYLKSLI